MRISNDAFDWVMVLVIIFVAGIVSLAIMQGVYRPASVTDVTAKYDIEEILPWHRVYRVVPEGAGQTLYVIVRDGEPVGIRWDTPAGKHNHSVSVITPLQGGKRERRED